MRWHTKFRYKEPCIRSALGSVFSGDYFAVAYISDVSTVGGLRKQVPPGAAGEGHKNSLNKDRPTSDLTIEHKKWVRDEVWWTSQKQPIATTRKKWVWHSVASDPVAKTRALVPRYAIGGQTHTAQTDTLITILRSLIRRAVIRFCSVVIAYLIYLIGNRIDTRWSNKPRPLRATVRIFETSIAFYFQAPCANHTEIGGGGGFHWFCPRRREPLFLATPLAYVHITWQWYSICSVVIANLICLICNRIDRSINQFITIWQLEGWSSKPRPPLDSLNIRNVRINRPMPDYGTV